MDGFGHERKHLPLFCQRHFPGNKACSPGGKAKGGAKARPNGHLEATAWRLRAASGNRLLRSLLQSSPAAERVARRWRDVLPLEAEARLP